MRTVFIRPVVPVRAVPVDVGMRQIVVIVVTVLYQTSSSVAHGADCRVSRCHLLLWWGAP
jgi:hypothetical protein